jgi:hypothetical protein
VHAVLMFDIVTFLYDIEYDITVIYFLKILSNVCLICFAQALMILFRPWAS